MLIFCNGMLRSGSAFQFNLVCSLLEKTSSCKRHGRWEPKEKFTENQLNLWAKDKSTFHVIKSGRNAEEFQMANKNLAKMIYINRDLRDVAVAAKFKWSLSEDNLIEMLDRALSGYEVMVENNAFVSDWCLHQKYEEVYNDTRNAVRQIASFLDLNPSNEIIEDVVKECSIDNMLKVSESISVTVPQNLLRILGKLAGYVKAFLPPPYNESWKLRKYYLKILPKVDSKTVIAPRHIEPTKGMPGAWKEELTLFEIKAIGYRYKDYLSKEGYLSENDQNNLYNLDNQ